MFDLTGKTALVTGSSRGIGRAVALCLAEAGADVVVHCTGRPEKAQEVVDAIRAMGRKAWFIQKNLMDEDCAEYIFSRLEQPLDILVLNASIQYRKAWEQITAQDFAEQINVNLRASMLLIQKAVPHMREQHWGRIVTVGSVQEAKPHPDMLVYSASKAGQRMMAQSLAGQLAKDGITVNNMAPGVIAT
ncbi:MAG: SDR family oxidoreductase, partial [Eubacteriales bacterium]|nr:SDR family oxidoreductase [Eubacteriales bacterium]